METIELYKCTACESLDTITFTSDCGICMECGTPENYEYIETEEDV